MTKTKTATFRDLFTFLFAEGATTPLETGREFGIDTTDAEEALADLEEEGTLDINEDDGTYFLADDTDSTELEDYLKSREMLGFNLDSSIVKEKEPEKPKKKEVKVSTKKKSTKKKSTKTGPDDETPETPETQEDESQEQQQPKPKKKTKGKKSTTTKKKETTKKAPKKTKVEKKKAPKGEKAEKKERKVTPRSSWVAEDGDYKGQEVKACVDCKTIYPKMGGQFRPRFKDPQDDAQAKTVQPRCLACDKLRSKRKSRFQSLLKLAAIEELGDPEKIVTHPDRKNYGLAPDGKFSVALIDDTGDAFTPALRGFFVDRAYDHKNDKALILLRWKSGDAPEITGVTKKAAGKVKAPKLTPAPEKKATKKKTKVEKKKTTTKKGTTKKRANKKDDTTDITKVEDKPKAKKKTPRKKKAGKKVSIEDVKAHAAKKKAEAQANKKAKKDNKKDGDPW